MTFAQGHKHRSLSQITAAAGSLQTGKFESAVNLNNVKSAQPGTSAVQKPGVDVLKRSVSSF
ncbi:MAG: hypothetical protein AB8B51_07310 [Sedimentitalea sp.]